MRVIANAPAAGERIKRNNEPPNCFATLKIIGNITTKPASKKIGNPNRNEATPKAKGAFFSPNLLIKVSAALCTTGNFQ